jgi:hypothetical protein
MAGFAAAAKARKPSQGDAPQLKVRAIVWGCCTPEPQVGGE